MSDLFACSFWNFDALFQPQQHPARDAHDTFFLTCKQLLPLVHHAAHNVHCCTADALLLLTSYFNKLSRQEQSHAQSLV